MDCKGLQYILFKTNQKTNFLKAKATEFPGRSGLRLVVSSKYHHRRDRGFCSENNRNLIFLFLENQFGLETAKWTGSPVPHHCHLQSYICTFSDTQKMIIDAGLQFERQDFCL
ncbi:hypothetical protein E2320_013298, partial [Naja naja]